LTFIQIWRILLDIFLPEMPSCLICRSQFQNKGVVCICPDCLNGFALADGTFHPVLQRGDNNDIRYLTSVRSVMAYTGFARDLIRAMKFQGKSELAEPLGQLMAQYYREVKPFPRFQAIVPVPLHVDRLRERGFNQAELLARHVATASGVPVTNVLQRQTQSAPQSLQKGYQRRAHVRGSFICGLPGEVSGKNVLLIDDIYTTGSTLDECAKELLRCGVRQVYGLTLAVVKTDEELSIERDMPAVCRSNM
jgi:ComF family protein